MRTLVVFVKQPVPGRVKTRLAADLGAKAAARLYVAFTGDLVRRFQTVGDRRVLFHAPDDDAARVHFRDVGGDAFALRPQPETSLGGRLDDVFSALLQNAGDRVVAIGSDGPTLPTAIVDSAFDALEDRDCVLGPATDGGYYLVGLRTPYRSVFEGVEWSSSQVLEQTVERVESSGLSLSLLPPWYDVDTFDDLCGLVGHLRAMRAAGESPDLPATEAALAEIDLAAIRAGDSL